jgi:hypothetical protein
MFNIKTVKTINLCRFAATALLCSTLTLTYARPTVASPQPVVSQQAVAPMQIVFLYVNGIPVNCSAWCFRDESHVYDFASGEVVGYINASAPSTIVNSNGAVIGFLATI